MRLLIVVAMVTSCTAGWFDSAPCVPESCEDKYGPEMTSTKYGDEKTCESDQKCHAKKCRSLLSPGTPFIVYAHMTNNVASVDWAIEQGANAVEMDVNFEGAEPKGFQHGWPCDCTCIGPYVEGLKSKNLEEGQAVEKKTICQFQDAEDSEKDICLGLTSLTDMFGHLSMQTELSIVYLDCKLGQVAGMFDSQEQKKDKYTSAGASLAASVYTDLFQAGFTGNIVVNGIDVEYIDFLKAFRAEFEGNPQAQFKNRIAYVFDMAKDAAISLGALRDADFKHITYGNGISSCVNSMAGYGPEMSKDMRLAGQNTDSFAVGATLWTIDNQEVMRQYVLDYGVRGLMTNIPAMALELVNQVGGTLDHFQNRDFPNAPVAVESMQLTPQPCTQKGDGQGSDQADLDAARKAGFQDGFEKGTQQSLEGCLISECGDLRYGKCKEHHDKCSWHKAQGACREQECVDLRYGKCKDNNKCSWSEGACHDQECVYLRYGKCKDNNKCSWSKGACHDQGV